MSNSLHHPDQRKSVSLASLQYIEKVFGSIVCGLLHIPAKMIPRPRDMNPEHVRKMLVIKFFGIGSLVLATPFFREVRKRFPNAQIHLLTLSSNRQVMEMIEDVDQTHFVDLGGSIGAAVVAYAGCLWSTLRRRYDVVIDMEFYTRASAVVSLASWAPVRIGYHAQGIYRGDIQSHRVPFNSYWHVSRNFLSLLEPYGYRVNETEAVPALKIAAGLRKPAEALAEKLGGGRYVVINVNAGELAYERRWFPARFADLAARLSQRFDLTCVFIGAPSERTYVQAVASDAEAQGARVVNAAGKLDLMSLAQICRDSALVISNDSGPLHIAAATGTPVVGFFGPETPVLYGPAGAGHLVFHKNLSCSPCINIEQGKRFKCWHATAICQQATTAADAFEAISARYDDVLKA
ncbi:glycosyltransferase family 9 protein [Magnetovibrio sp.]|uniref:glycosyltransferase family 9 protein n=1 Tax=Magnetovibrio sp. TaxID=2024836 RepID=UPI002F921125